MDKLIIKTNHHKIPIIYGYELPEKARKEFDYYDSDEELDDAVFLKYKGNYYDESQFTRLENPKGDLAYWDGIVNDTAFSGVLIKVFPDDPEYVEMAYYYG
jgi:hypothetical protein